MLSKIERRKAVRMVARRCAGVRNHECSRGCRVGSRGHRLHRASLNERRLRTSYIFSADFFFLRINRSRKSDVFEIFSKKKTAARADLVGRYSVDQDLNLILGPRWRPGPKFNMDHI